MISGAKFILCCVIGGFVEGLLGAAVVARLVLRGKRVCMLRLLPMQDAGAVSGSDWEHGSVSSDEDWSALLNTMLSEC